MGHSWHPADIYALIRKRGGTYSSIAAEYGLERSTPGQAQKRWCYAGEQAISAFIGVPAHELWPDRYDADGLPLHPRIRKAMFNDLNRTNPRKNVEAA